MTTLQCSRCRRFISPLRPHNCPCSEWEHRRRSPLTAFLALAALTAALVGLYAAAPRPSSEPSGAGATTGAPLLGGSPVPVTPGQSAVTTAASGAPPSPAASTMTEPSDDGYGTGTPVQSVPATDTVTRQGILAYAEPSYGPSYLATPERRGTLIVVCGVRACTEPIRTTDVGPDLALQRQGRIADVSSTMFEAICGELRFGLCPGSYTVVERPSVTPPATDEEER